MSSRQSLGRSQGIASSKNASRSRNQASGLIATSTVATNIVNGTISIPDASESVIARDDGSWLVRSPKFARYYQVLRTENGWKTSSSEEKFQSYLINAVEQYEAALAQAA